MTAIFERELKSFFTGITGYIFGACILIFGGIYTMVINLSQGYNSLDYVYGNMGFIFLLAIPILTMRTIAEERKQKTDQLLYSLPVSMGKIVMGKYLAMLVVLAVPVVIMGLYPIIFSAFGTVNFKTSYSALLAFYFLGAALTAMGMFVSSLTDNQVVSAVLCLILMVVNYFISDLADYVSASSGASLFMLVIIVIAIGALIWFLTKNLVTGLAAGIIGEAAVAVSYKIWPSKFEGLFANIIGHLSLYERFYSFMNELFDITSLVYFLMVILVFVFLTIQSLEKRRWS